MNKKQNDKRLIIFMDCGDTIIDEGTEIRNEQDVVIKADVIPGADTMVQTLAELKERGLWVVGADMSAKQDVWEADLTGPLVLVIGGEDKGLGRLVRETCDFLVRIPMRGHINSLNAAVAGAVLLFETFRQRSARVGTPARG